MSWKTVLGIMHTGNLTSLDSYPVIVTIVEILTSGLGELIEQIR